MDIRGLVYRVVDYFPGPLKTPARYVADAVFGVWDDVSMVFRVSIPYWRDVANGAYNIMTYIYDYAYHAAVTARWIVSLYVPRIVGTTGQTIIDWAFGLISQVRDYAARAIQMVIDWAWQHLLSIVDYLSQLRTWLIDRFNEVWQPLRFAFDRVSLLLTDPGKFAEWAIGAIWSAFWRYALDHLEEIVTLIWSRRATILTRTVDQTETILDRLL